MEWILLERKQRGKKIPHLCTFSLHDMVKSYSSYLDGCCGCWKTRCVGSLSGFVTHFTSIYNNAASLILFSSLFGSIARPWTTMRAWERERALAEMTSGIKSRPESSHHCGNTPATATHLATCIQIQMRPFLTSSHSWHCCHSVSWQSGEKVRRSIIPLLTGRVRRPWPPRLNFKWITEGGAFYVKRETVQHMTGNYFPWCHSVNGSLLSPLLLRAAPPARLTFDRHFFRV